MPPFWQKAAKRHFRRHRRANDAVIQKLTGQLHSARQEGIRRAAYKQPFRSRQFHQLGGFRHRKGGHFFAVHILARFQRRLGDLEVGRRIGGIDDHFNGGIRKDLFVGHAANAIFLRTGLAAVRPDVRESHQIQNIEAFLHVLEIDPTDHAAADQRRLHFFQLLHMQHLLCFLVALS